MNTLPQAIQLVLPMLAADGGRARVQTLLAIQGAGPDYVRQHLTGIDAALGTASPGTTALGDLIRKAEDSVSTPSTVERQHFISQGVLRRFVENLPSGQKLAKFNIATGRVEHLSTRRVGYVSHFVPVDSEATEKLWQEVENHLTQATTAALNGTALTNPAHLSTLRHAVALHFARNPQTLTIHNQSFADALKGQVDQLAKTPLAAEAFKRQHHGLEPAGTEALRMGAEGYRTASSACTRTAGCSASASSGCSRWSATGSTPWASRSSPRPAPRRSSCSATSPPSPSTTPPAPSASPRASPPTKPTRSSCPSRPGCS